MEFFAHPWYMAAGGLLVSAPILIHLINRMRFKRVRWAAMEFLLKSQKRNRRRMIIEQLILLLLRILLVLLAAFLVARFLYGGTGPRGATHVVIVDDTLSMNDAGKQGEESSSAFNTAIVQVKKVARNASKAASAQYMRIFLLSELDKSPIFDARLGDGSEREIDEAFVKRGNKPTLLAGSPMSGLERGQKYFSDMKSDQGQKFIHLVSDFRDRDWTTGPDAEKVSEVLRSILDAGVNLNLIDTAAPSRTPNSKVANHHDNIAIVDLKAESRVAVEDSDIEFTASVMNLGQAEGRTFLKVYINGEESPGSDTVLEKIAPNSKVEHKFTLRFNSKRKGTEINPKDGPEERERKRRLEREYNVIRVALQREEVGLNADNVRDLVLEVRKKVPTLVVDGNKPEGRGDGGDMSHLAAFYAASGIYEVEERRLEDLAKSDLDLYPGVILLNVAELPEAAIKKLQSYVNNGGSVTWFLGEETKADHFNTALFNAGLFPVLLEDRPYDPFAAQGIADPEQRKKLRDAARQTDPKPKILFPDATNVLVQRLAPAQGLFRYLGINVYWKARVRSTWDPDGRQTKPLVVLPNTQSMDVFKGRALSLMESAAAAVTKLAAKEEEYRKYLPLMDEYKTRTVRNAIATGELFALAEALDSLLNSQQQLNDKREETRPSMTSLWQQVDLKPLADEIREFRERVLFGDPLVVSRTVGKGRVLAMLTPAGTNLRKGVGEDGVQWNNWGAGDRIVSNLYPLFLLDVHRFMISEGQAPNRVLGEETTFAVDAARYMPDVSYTFEPQPDVSVAAAKIEPEREKGVMEKQENLLSFALKDVKRPGVFRVTLTQLGEGPLEDRQETRAYAYNVDATAESDLKRAGRERLLPDLPPGDAKRGKLALLTPTESFDQFQEKTPDASESPWIYLFFILILVVEQAMAVHLSYHLKGNENAPPASSPPVAA